MSNSSLVSYTKISPNRSSPRNNSVDRITPHCVVGQCSVETLGNIFAPTSREASSNYGIGVDGRVGMYCEEKDRSWCSSNRENDNRAITIECASDTKHPYTMNAKVYATLIELCVDICKRYGKTKLLWLADKEKTLAYKPKQDEMVLTVHRWFANKSCPGDWLYNRLGDLAQQVTAKLGSTVTTPPKEETPAPAPATTEKLYRVQMGAFAKKDNADALLKKVKAAGYDAFITTVGELYKVQVGAYKKKANAEKQAEKLKAAGFEAIIVTATTSATDTPAKTEFKPYLVKVDTAVLRIRKAPSTEAAIVGSITSGGVYTIVAESNGTGAKSWGKLKSGAGWISLDYITKLREV